MVCILMICNTQLYKYAKLYTRAMGIESLQVHANTHTHTHTHTTHTHTRAHVVKEWFLFQNFYH